jgi:hypothetical protein
MQDRYLHRTTQTQNERRQTSMPSAGFKPMIPVFKRMKTFHALDRAAIVIGTVTLTYLKYPYCLFAAVIWLKNGFNILHKYQSEFIIC